MCVCVRAGLALVSATYVAHILLLTQWVIKRRPHVYARWREAFGTAAIVHCNLVVVNLGGFGCVW